MNESGEIRPFRRGTTPRYIVNALEARGHAVRYDILMLKRGGDVVPFRVARFNIAGVDFIIRNTHVHYANPDGSLGRGVDGRSIGLFLQKDMVKSMLRRVGVAVPEGMTFSGQDAELAMQYFMCTREMFDRGVCIKPVMGVQGKDVHVGVTAPEAFGAAFASVAENWSRIMVEEVVSGDVYRFTVIGGEVVAARYGLPQNVVGDGVSTIEDLVEKKRARRKKHPVFRLQPFPFGESQLLMLRKQGLDVGFRPESGRRVFLGTQSNSHVGADVIECMDSVHASYIRLVERAVASMPDIVACGADIIIKDLAKPADEHNYAVIEFNTGPGFAASSRPWKGKRRDIARRLVVCLEQLALKGSIQFDEGEITPHAPSEKSRGSWFWRWLSFLRR